MASITTTDVMQRVLLRAFPEGTDPELEASIAKVLGHVWFSCLVAGATGWATSPGSAASPRPPPTSSATTWSSAYLRRMRGR